LRLTFGNVKHPPFVDRLIPDAETSAWDDLGPRRPVGVCQHSMVGSLMGTDRWFRRGAASSGLTDYGVGGATDGPPLDGVIFRWNDPRGRVATVYRAGETYVPAGTPGAAAWRVSANRAGWANGGSDGLEGDGPLFVRTLGVAAINRDLVSIERSDGGDAATPMSDKQVESICALTAYWADQAAIPWDRFPLNPRYGVVTHLLHSEFATKSCPHAPVTGRIDELQARIRQILKAGQTRSAAPSPLPPATPVEPDHATWPAGYTAETLRERFGALTRHNEDGRTTRAPFDPTGVISNAWTARGAAEGLAAEQLPAALHWWVLRADGDQAYDLVTFDGRWTLFRPDRHVAWRWIE
jgi:N-acetylmuramoyl-L-alanine amidase